VDAQAETAFSVFGWSPAEFWDATPWDFWAAFAGFKRKNQATAGNSGGLSDADKKALIARREQRKRKEAGRD